MCLTGNHELSKDILGKQINYLASDNEKQQLGVKFLKRIIKRVDLLGSIEYIEDRFLPDGEKHFLIIVVESLTKG
jgi:hypothetical protein